MSNRTSTLTLLAKDRDALRKHGKLPLGAVFKNASILLHAAKCAIYITFVGWVRLPTSQGSKHDSHEAESAQGLDAITLTVHEQIAWDLRRWPADQVSALRLAESLNRLGRSATSGSVHELSDFGLSGLLHLSASHRCLVDATDSRAGPY